VFYYHPCIFIARVFVFVAIKTETLKDKSDSEDSEMAFKVKSKQAFESE